MSEPDITLLQALDLLGLREPFAAQDLTRAFRGAVKAARPDVPDGDAERFGRVIAAYHLLRAQSSGMGQTSVFSVPAPALPVVCITPLQALHGGLEDVVMGRHRLRIRLPKGLRSGDRLRLRRGPGGGHGPVLSVLIRPDAGVSVVGDDLYMEWPVEPRLLEDGGRGVVDTHAGSRSIWVTPGLASPVRLRLRDLGLPTRGRRPTGHLFVTLTPSEDIPSAAEDLLERFTRVWTPQRLAA